jgi:hypothetical protein
VVAGPADETAASTGARGHLRAAHADREQAIGTLKAAFVQGRLAKDEFDLRVGQAFASRTYAELAAVTADLPVGPAAAQPHTPARAGDGQPAVRPGAVLTAATALYASVWLYVPLSPNGGDNPVAGALVFLGALVYLGIVLICGGAMAISRRERRSGGQPPGPPRRPGVGGPSSGRPPPAGPGGRLPPAGSGHWAAAGAGV